MSEPGEITLEDDEMHDETFPNDVIEASKNHLLVSPIQNLVEMATYRIDFEPSKVKFLLQIMEEELITKVWQLQYMDSANWRDMGFPIGLVASIRRLMHENGMTEPGEKHNNNEYGFKGYPSPAATELEPQEEAGAAREGSHGEGTNMKRISDITISERLSNRLLISPYRPKKKISSANNDGQAIKVSTKDEAPVSAPRRSSKKGLQADDLSDAETFAIESVAMRLVGSKESEEKVHHNASMAVVTGSFGDIRELLVEGVADEVGESETKF
ncbi:MAG: hypothetical protein SGBAC_004056 [Bacillariaceae sp.]